MKYHGMRLGEEIVIKIEQGKVLIIKLVSIEQPEADGKRIIYFELDGHPREVFVKDDNIQTTATIKRKA